MSYLIELLAVLATLVPFVVVAALGVAMASHPHRWARIEDRVSAIGAGPSAGSANPSDRRVTLAKYCGIGFTLVGLVAALWAAVRIVSILFTAGG